MDNNPATDKRKKTLVWSKIVKYGIPLVISAGLCYALFHNMDLNAMITFIKEDCDFSIIALVMTIGLLTFLIRGLRWRIQLRAAGIDPPLHAMIFSIAGTYAVNIVFPRLGEVWRSEYIAHRQKAPFVTVLGSMISDRLADTVTVMILLLVTFFLAGNAVDGFIDRYPAAYNSVSGFISSPLTYIIIAAAITAAWWFMRHKSTNRWVNRVQQQFRNLGGGFLSIFKMRGKALWLLLTALLWGSYFFQLYLCFEAFGFTNRILEDHGEIVVLVCFVLSSISMGIPSNGGIGPYQAAIIFGLGCFMSQCLVEGSEANMQAGAFANTVLGAQTLLTIICGIVTFIAIGIENRRLSKSR